VNASRTATARPRVATDKTHPGEPTVAMRAAAVATNPAKPAEKTGRAGRVVLRTGEPFADRYGLMPVVVARPVKRREPSVHSGMPSGQRDSDTEKSSSMLSYSRLMPTYQRGSLRM